MPQAGLGQAVGIGSFFGVLAGEWFLLVLGAILTGSFVLITRRSAAFRVEALMFQNEARARQEASLEALTRIAATLERIERDLASRDRSTN